MNNRIRQLLDIDDFRKLNNPEQIVTTKHAKDRMFERGIGVDDVISCICNGEMIRRYEDDKPLPSCLVVGLSATGKQMHVVVSNDSKFIYLITAYYPDPKIWGVDFTDRKER